jgi:heptosyltransferase-2
LEKNKKILIIQSAFLGDVIMTTPLFRAVKEIEPSSEIHVLVIPAAAGLLNANPNIDHVHVFNKKSGLLIKAKELFRLIKLFSSIKFDIGISVQHSLTSSLIMLLSAIPYRIGNQKMKFVSQKVQIPFGLHNRHRVLSLLLPLSTKSFSVITELHLPDPVVEKTGKLININNSSDAFKLGISPGSVWETKKWHKSYYSELIDLLGSHGFNIYLFGSPQENELCATIKKNSSYKNIFNYAGKLSLKETAGMVSKMNLMLTNDSAPLHIANALNVPVYSFFGPTVRKFGCYPYREKDKMLQFDLECRPCAKHGGNKCPLGHHNCMKLIKPEYVYNEIMEFFKMNKS